MMAAALGVLGAVLCALSPAWGARGRHGLAIAFIAGGAALALCAAVTVLR